MRPWPAIGRAMPLPTPHRNSYSRCLTGNARISESVRGSAWSSLRSTVPGCATCSMAGATARWCWCTKWAARSKAGRTPRGGSAKRAGCCVTTAAARACRRRCGASFPSIRWPTISRPCSIATASQDKSRWWALPSAARSRCISPRVTPDAPAPSWPAAPRPALRPTAVPRCSARLAKIEAEGMAFAVEESMRNGYPDELRGDIRRFERYRARWLGNDPSSYATVYRMLAATEMEDELARLRCPVLVIGGHVRSYPPATALENHGRRYSRRAVRGSPHRPLHGGADTRPPLRPHRRFPALGRRLTPPLITRSPT